MVRYELTALGRAALEDDAPEAHACVWCEEALAEGDAIIATGAGRLLHNTPCCRGAFETFIAAEDAQEVSHA